MHASGLSHAQAILIGWAVVLAAVAVLAGWREHRRRGRSNPDAVGLIAWPTVQLLALIGLGICGLLAFHL